jgi:hypothetical protein
MINVVISPGNEIRIDRKDILATDLDPVSMMPPRLDQSLTSAELADLLAFLRALPYRIDRLIEIRETQ